MKTPIKRYFIGLMMTGLCLVLGSCGTTLEIQTEPIPYPYYRFPYPRTYYYPYRPYYRARPLPPPPRRQSYSVPNNHNRRPGRH